ncbi:hypothetical protein BDV32DRAFT_155212 [Aspergillus pseudonomiae]|uniref:Uncharacterized protein n=1 Tax=Aspergillus pseudonomiae TaxID=1506151 RepID=A0A5N6HIU4_9EURO|nr:uncharacterized protein BDV37DRAFT_282670 [Aspergillus pseudonomiae]KAB8254451.1 hypothetical protein BDV32DRAFT_155212 [Aspergillus pseudonomiae]KAE8404631.1 hypothetical protein BDV37DRAFT_282670 [Aspergillus pseudonomiae]
MSVPIYPESMSDAVYWWVEIDVSGVNSSFEYDFDPITDDDDHNKKTRFAAMTKQHLQNDRINVKISDTDNRTIKICYCICIGPFTKGTKPTVEKGRDMMLAHLEKELQAPSEALDALEAYWREMKARRERLEEELSDQQRRSFREATPVPPGAPRLGYYNDDDIPEERVEPGQWW